MKNNKESKPEIFNLLTSLGELTSLKNLSFSLPEDAKLFWNHFKPRPFLRYLTLKFNISDLLNESNKDITRHWKEIKELEALELKILCGSVREIMLTRFLTTKILKKIHKLHSLEVSLEGSFDPLGFQACVELFVAEDIPHLHESLKSFEFYLRNLSKGLDVEIDLKMTKLRFFKNLKEVKFEGSRVCFESLDKIVDFLQENQKVTNDYPTLEVNLETKARSRWVGETLQKIQKIKRNDRNVKIIMNLIFKTNTPHGMKKCRLVEIFEEFCENVQAVNTIKGLVIYLNVHDKSYFSWLPVEDVKGILEKYAGLRNVNVCLRNFIGSMEYVNMHGEKRQFIVDEKD